MKRDLDFARQLLFEMERHGFDCPVDVLRNGSTQEIDERTRYHLKLMADAGFIKEVERTPTGAPCFRLTNAGHEFIELTRSDARWREAKWCVEERTGGLSLTVLRAVLTRWAMEAFAEGDRYRRWRRRYRPYYYGRDYGRDFERGDGAYRVASYRYEREPTLFDEPARAARRRAEYFEPWDARDQWAIDAHASACGNVDESLDNPFGVSLPVYMI